MNILIVTAMYPPIRTGTSFYSKNLADSFHKAGHKITVVTAKNPDIDSDNDPYPVIRLTAFYINLRNYFKHLRFVSFFPQNYYRMLKIIRKHRPDVILLINHYLDIAFPAIFSSMYFKIPLVISVGTQLQSLNPVRNRILNILDYLICGYMVLPFAKKIISWDREIERYLNEIHNKRFANKSVIIPFGANGNLDIFSIYKHSYEIKNQILGVGALIDHRNYVFQVEVFKELLNQFPEMRLKIIGNIYYKEAVMLVEKYGIHGRVIFMGEQPHEVVLSEMKKSDIHWMMLDGNYKGLGTSNLEAMLLGVPIVSNIPDQLFGTGSLVDMESFIYTDGKSKEIIINKLSHVLKSKKERSEIGKNGQKFVKEKMNWRIVAEEMQKLFLTVKK